MTSAGGKTRSWLLLLLPLFGCKGLMPDTDGTEAFDVERAPTFSAKELVQGGTAIAAMVSSEPERHAQEASSTGLASALRVKFLHDRPGMRVLSPGNVEQVLGPDRYETLASRLELTGQVENLAELRQDLHAVRYLMVGRLERDVVSTDKDPQIYTTSRDTRMSFAIYDLQNASLAWKGSFKTCHITSCPGPDPEDEDVAFERSSDDGFLEFLGKELGNELLDTDPEITPPEPVSIQEQADWIYDEFLETLFDSGD